MNLPDYLMEGTRNFGSYSWKAETNNRGKYFYTNFCYKTTSFFIFDSNNTLSETGGCKYLISPADELNPFTETGKVDLSYIERVRSELVDTLESRFNAGYLAEEYMHIAIRYQIHINDLAEASPIILACLDESDSFTKMYQNVEIAAEYYFVDRTVLVKLAGLTDDVTIFNELLQLPMDTLNSL